MYKNSNQNSKLNSGQIDNEVESAESEDMIPLLVREVLTTKSIQNLGFKKYSVSNILLNSMTFLNVISKNHVDYVSNSLCTFMYCFYKTMGHLAFSIFERNNFYYYYVENYSELQYTS